MNAYLVKPRRRRAGKLVIGPYYLIRWRPDRQSRWVEVPLHVRDKSVAVEKLRGFRRDKERELAGISLPDGLVEGAGKTLAVHLGDWIAELISTKRDAMYCYNLRKRVEILISECGWVLPRDVTVDSFCQWRGRQTKAAKTLNDFLSAASGLLNWMVRRGRLLANPLLGGVSKVSTSGVESKRRALSDDEMGRLLSVAGPRKAVYLLAALTGLRRSEVEGLRWGDVHLDALKPFLSVRASTTKNGKAAQIWVRDDLAASLRAVRPAECVSGAGVW